MTILLVLLAIVLVVLFTMLGGAVVVGTSAAWFLETPFMDGWHAAWDKPWVLLGFAIIAGALVGGSKS